MSENVAVIASVLKPVDDTRLFEKLGLTIRESKKYQVNIIGFKAKIPTDSAGVIFHPLYSGGRLGLGRLLVPWKFLGKLIRLRPDLLVVSTPELLIPAVIYKSFLGTRLWYDVQENYRKNVQYQSSYPHFVKPFLKLILWLTETFTRPFIERYLLAEEGYLNELRFIRDKHTVLENKYKRVEIKQGDTNTTQSAVSLIFNGTCSKENGILEAISLTETMLRHRYPVRLNIVGQVPDKSLLKYIKDLMSKYQGCIQLLSNGSLASHITIMEQVLHSDFGLVAHQVNPSNQNCVPTKIYEYLGLHIPMILQSHPLWESKVRPYPGALVIDYKTFNPDLLWHQMQTVKFYQTKPGPEISWEQEALKLLELL